MKTQKKKIKWNYKKCMRNLFTLFLIVFAIVYYIKTMNLYNKTIEKNVAEFTKYAEETNTLKTEENYKEFINK